MASYDPSKVSARGREAHAFFLDVQDEITRGLTGLDPNGFREDRWEHDQGGGGRTRVILEGSLFEKGGVNVSAVFGELPEAFAAELPGTGRRYFATGISLVLHPRSPHVPTVHANFRYLEKGDGPVAWFGGGADLTPWILYDEDAVHFHRVWRDVTARHPVVDHRALKKWCDEYFYLPHREETRGIGGIFFDYLGLPPPRGIEANLDDAFRFVKDAAGHFLEAYVPIVERRRGLSASEEERMWQLTRRGRYVEFNLIYDRGTIFGLKTKGRIESILMSLPTMVRWGYAESPKPGTYQERLIEALQKPRDWLSETKDG
jgi:coproporphyrinogen III oxidase